jgi:hypothetical protein
MQPLHNILNGNMTRIFNPKTPGLILFYPMCFIRMLGKTVPA